MVTNFTDILEELANALTTRISPILDDIIFIAMATFLDTYSYQFRSVDELLEPITTIFNRFQELFEANGCERKNLLGEFRVLHCHVKTFFKSTSSSKCWPQLFQLKDSLTLNSILHIAELCIAVPLSNAECERVFSFMWRVYNKDLPRYPTKH